MGNLDNHVLVSISQDAVRVRKAEFGVPLLLSPNATFAERVRTYEDVDGVEDDGFATDSPEYLFAQALFGEDPTVEKFKIGRCANKPTQVYTIIPTEQDSHVYSFEVIGEGITTETVTFTSDSSASLAEVVAGITTALNSVTGKNYTAVDTTSTSVVVTGTAAGDWFSIEPLDLANIEITQTHADPGIAADLSAIETYDGAWYTLCTLYNSNAMVLAADAWIATRKKIYVFDCNETDALNTAAGNSDTLDDIATLTRTRTAGIFNPGPANMNAARWCGSRLAKVPGSATWAATQLTGLAAVSLTTTQRTNLMARNANIYEEVAGLSIMSYGTTADGDYIDVQRFIDWQDDDMSTAVFAAIVAADKIGMTDEDLVAIEAEIRGSLARGVEAGGLASDPAPSVAVPLVASLSTADKLARLLAGTKWAATLRGAVHKVNIAGNVSP